MEIARHWRLNQQRYKLVGERCNSCESFIFPPRDACPICGSHGVIYKAPISFGNALALRKGSSKYSK
ncbi:MAG: zinc ribbon domain-containing protein [Patescibacteria group bacterium]